MKICICQYSIEWENKQANKRKICDILSKVKQQVQWIIFPETCLTGFTFNKNLQTTYKDLTFFSEITKKFRAYLSFGGVYNKENVCITINPEGSLISKTSKIHMFSPSGEHLYHKQGSTFSPFIINNTRITPFICYDLRFAPMFWTAAEKTDVFLVIANWPEKRRTHWKTLLRARAIENQAFVIGVNRTGSSPVADYYGDSCVISPDGEIILDAKNREKAFIVDIKPDDVCTSRKNFPVLKDRKKFSDYGCFGK